GQDKVKTEWGLVSIAHNLKKLVAKWPPTFFTFLFLTPFLHFSGCLKFVSRQPHGEWEKAVIIA
ncbi:MAG: hypothetical protein ABSA01_17530, partial [Anaerolineales bacterium]